MPGPDSDRREGGFIVLHRRLRSWPLWQSLTALQQRVWIEMLMEANWRPSEVVVVEGRFAVTRGEFVTSQEQLAAQVGVSRKVVRQTYAHLLREGAVSQRDIGTGIGQRKGHRVVATTIVNYSKYQDLPEKEGRGRAGVGPHQNQGNQGNQEASRSDRKFQPTRSPPLKGGGTVLKFNPDDVLTVWDPTTETYVTKGFTVAGRDRLGRKLQ